VPMPRMNMRIVSMMSWLQATWLPPKSFRFAFRSNRYASKRRRSLDPSLDANLACEPTTRNHHLLYVALLSHCFYGTYKQDSLPFTVQFIRCAMCELVRKIVNGL
jgi:hypothetical protein